ncbi:MAG TPA: CPBP family intramembrane glutamic endopeptidase [Pseudothermotoga sp.]
MAFFLILLVLLGMVVLQYFSKVIKRNRIPFIALCQVLYSIALFVFLKIPYTFEVQFKGFLSFLVVFGIMIFLGGFLGAEQIKFYKKISPFDIVFIGILLPISEEIIFRGAILYLLPSAFLNALIFSSIHLANVLNRMEKFSIFNFIYRLAVGYIFARSVLITQSLFCAMLCHVINNSVSLLVLTRSEHIAKKGTDTAEHKDGE